MNLIDALNQYCDGLTDQQAFDFGNTVVNLDPDHTVYTWAGIGQKLIENGVNPTDVVNLASNITSLPGGPLLNNALLSGGFDFANALNRQIIESFEVNEPEWAVTVLNAMLAIGQPTGTNWSKWGVSQPTLEAITEARAAKSTAQQQIEAFFSGTLNPLVSGGTTPQAIKAAVDSWVAGL